MGTLSKTEILKTASSGPYAGNEREDIFDLKIRDGKTFTLGATKSGEIVEGVFYDRKSKLFTYKTKDGVAQVTLTKIFKDKDFGGGAGSGGGAEDTKYTESLQCYYCSYVFNIAKKQVKAVSDNDLENATEWVDASVKLADCLKSGPKVWIETDVYLKTANKLFEKYGRKMLKNGNVYFHRGSKFMSNVYSAKKVVQKLDKKTASPQAPGSFSEDKWNPGDIWASTFNKNDKPLEDYTSSWGELNARVYELASSGQLLGISLKKVGAKATQATFTEYNSPKLSAQNSRYTFTYFTYGRTGDFFNSQDIYITTSAGQVQFRTFGGQTAWQGEIKGGEAAGGKIGGGNVEFFCQQVFGSGIYGRFNNEKEYLASIKRDERDETFEKNLYEQYKKHNDRSVPSTSLLSEGDFINRVKAATYNWKNSKALCMNFLDVLENGTPQEKNKLITKMYRYAQSNTDQSSYFVKLS